MKILILTLVAFILVDGVARSVVIAYGMNHGVINQEFFKDLYGYTAWFVLLKSWFYWPIALVYLFTARFFSEKKSFYCLLGAAFATVFYIIYVYEYSAFETNHGRFLTRIIQYPLFGALFGLSYYRYRMRKMDSSSAR